MRSQFLRKGNAAVYEQQFRKKPLNQQVFTDKFLISWSEHDSVEGEEWSWRCGASP